MKEKIRDFLTYIADRLTEPSTWQGLGFLIALTGCKLGAGMDWGAAAGLGGIISATLKLVLPDKK